MLPSQTDGVLFASWRMEGTQLVRRVAQPSESLILQLNQQIRNDPGAVRSLDWAKPYLKIPERAILALRKKYPDLASPHTHTRTKAWLKFLRSSESDPYRLQHRSRARG